MHRRVKLPLIMGWMAKNIPSRMNPFVSNNETKYSLNVFSEQITTHTFVARIGHKAVKLFTPRNATGWWSGQSWKPQRCTNVSNVQMFLKESCKHSIAASCATSTVPRALRLALARIKFDHRHNKKTKELLQVLK